MPIERDDLRDELMAVLGARQELSKADEAFLADNFLKKLDSEIDARIDARVNQTMMDDGVASVSSRIEHLDLRTTRMCFLGQSSAIHSRKTNIAKEKRDLRMFSQHF